MEVSKVIQVCSAAQVYCSLYIFKLSQVLWVPGLRAGERLAVWRRALVPLLQGVHSLPYQLHLCWSVPSLCPVPTPLDFHFQATLRLSTLTSTCWQTRLALLNGTTRMWVTSSLHHYRTYCIPSLYHWTYRTPSLCYHEINIFPLCRTTSSLQLTARCLKSTLPQLRKKRSENYIKGKNWGLGPADIWTYCSSTS